MRHTLRTMTVLAALTVSMSIAAVAAAQSVDDVETLVAAESFNEASAAFDVVVGAGASAEDYQRYARALVRADQANSAVGVLQDGVAAFPDEGRFHYLMAYLHRRDGRNVEAVRSYQTFLTFEPDDADAHYGMAECLNARGQTDEAVVAYERYLELETRTGRGDQIASAEGAIESIRNPVTATTTPTSGGSVFVATGSTGSTPSPSTSGNTTGTTGSGAGDQTHGNAFVALDVGDGTLENDTAPPPSFGGSSSSETQQTVTTDRTPSVATNGSPFQSLNPTATPDVIVHEPATGGDAGIAVAVEVPPDATTTALTTADLTNTGSIFVPLDSEPIVTYQVSSFSSGSAASAAGDVHMQSREWRSAQSAYDVGAQLAPDDATIWYKYGVASALSTDLSGARRAFERVRDIDPGFPGIDNILAQVESRAALEAQEAIDRPDFFADDTAREEALGDAIDEDNWLLAVRAAMALPPMAPLEASAYRALFEGRIDDAVEIAGQAVAEDPANLSLYLLAADALRIGGHHDRAQYFVQLFVELGGDESDAEPLSELLSTQTQDE